MVECRFHHPSLVVCAGLIVPSTGWIVDDLVSGYSRAVKSLSNIARQPSGDLDIRSAAGRALFSIFSARGKLV